MIRWRRDIVNMRIMKVDYKLMQYKVGQSFIKNVFIISQVNINDFMNWFSVWNTRCLHWSLNCINQLQETLIYTLCSYCESCTTQLSWDLLLIIYALPLLCLFHKMLCIRKHVNFKTPIYLTYLKFINKLNIFKTLCRYFCVKE